MTTAHKLVRIELVISCVEHGEVTVEPSDFDSYEGDEHDGWGKEIKFGFTCPKCEHYDDVSYG